MRITGYGVYLTRNDICNYFNVDKYSNFDKLLDQFCADNKIKVKRNWDRFSNNVFITNIDNIKRIDSPDYLENLLNFSNLFKKNIEFRPWNYRDDN